ncbi:A disintegrin and metalloproteinase with thrombospondin motifs 18 isoform X2 [Phyllopteryx taeniolatus]|uniref:A disintegrin and metalloproteinase with thrombospondin motifs 18 isoform X2 n=1 Tax=Phyllopteryx taeniolatus TaxID=161469 RepID=UPI002AD586EB|nr:A disintegrin and metalloproteinase with thrombospondin motifs 18 isoform X2 [Phyllopteryx taeniolatus]
MRTTGSPTRAHSLAFTHSVRVGLPASHSLTHSHEWTSPEGVHDARALRDDGNIWRAFRSRAHYEKWRGGVSSPVPTTVSTTTMDCLLLLIWTLPMPLVGCAPGRLLSTLLTWSLTKTLNTCCTHASLHTVSDGYFSSFSSSSSSSHGLNHDYAFATPVEVDSQGRYLSHDVSRRSRRSVSHSSSVHYRLTVFGRDVHLDLQPSLVVGPGFTVQTLGSGGITTVTGGEGYHDCLYQGFIRNLSSSSAAISTCSGLSGLIRVTEHDYLISPLPQHLAKHHNYSAPDGHQPHVIYKRSAEHVVRERAGDPSGVGPSTQHQDHHQHQDDLHGSTQKQHFCGRRKQYTPKPPIEDPFLTPDEFDTSDDEGPGRLKRSPIDSNRVGGLNVETLVVADRNMLEKHGRENVTTYILTVMNMLGLTINHHADQSLNSFCQWQSGLVGKSGKRHDHAVLLTGLDICSWKNEPCDTLGFAPISGMCSKYRSCTINEDTGLGLAFTIAHESGHNFGMIHDGEGNPCRKTEGNIMSPTLAGNNGVFSWSTCSRQYLNRFLGTTQASCLVDEPRQIGQYKYPEKLPGQLYDGDTQCKWQFGSKAKLCSLDFIKDICKSLWCHRTGHRCETKFMPAAEGTSCGPDMWCLRGQCVKYGDHTPKAVHGQWSAWSQWSECSRTCGGGVMYRERSCSSPRPQHNGKFCYGPGRQNQLCNTRPCPHNSVDFRSQQCAEYNNKPFRGWYYKWKPYTKVDDEDVCKLYCTAEDFDFFFAMSSKVKDGTYCSDRKGDVCIDGVCEAVGCDQILGSKASLDACGVCKGSNSTCKFYKGTYTLQHRANEYYSMVTIPPGARSIRVEEMAVSTSYLAVRSVKRKYYLTGDWTVDWPGKFHFGGATFSYQRSFRKPESLYAAGPTNETLVFEILLQGKNPGVVWEYTLPRTERKPDYSWGAVRSDCSAPCAGGRISTKAICLQDQKVHVNATMCNPLTRPTLGSHLCNMQPCPAYWWTGEWATCSRSCGGGQQSRTLRCMRKVTYQREEAAAHSLCPVVSPGQLRPCNTQACPPGWNAGAWTQCSKSCGRGLRKRSVFCQSGDPGTAAAVVPDSMCRQNQRPKAQESCVLRRCPKNDRLQWTHTSWGECSKSCGPGLQKRELRCGEKDFQGRFMEFPARRCRNLAKPSADLQQGCNRGPCPELAQVLAGRTVPSAVVSSWYSSPWQQCSVSCGGGVQTRNIQCLRQGRPAAGCLPHQRPVASRACNTQFCPRGVPPPQHHNRVTAAGTTLRGEPPCVDHFSWCHLVPQHGVCGHKFYGDQCCRSCTGRRL